MLYNKKATKTFVKKLIWEIKVFFSYLGFGFILFIASPCNMWREVSRGTHTLQAAAAGGDSLVITYTLNLFLSDENEWISPRTQLLIQKENYQDLYYMD